eukprot:Blabericola_migrator_1__582@NODE_1143_length_5295_cov_1502_992731_g298_i4_p2_GENE_NODE_1143_length_5295_cov_1502_992731_g298_i4NODE_1143_length_5295_cov_1502_992731_g298_i4_p2_ORF_typecomplete_len215_score27_21Acetyltransf_3/PF13302_7/8_3e10Acetyltransf_4/PF13420_7/0_016_NODE_1143_length_5295_cov_1502_992731_g298_i420372681
MPGWQGAKVPTAKSVLQGQYGRLEPLNPAQHKEDLIKTFKEDAKLLSLLPYGSHACESRMSIWLAQQAAGDDVLYAIVDKATAIGLLGYTNVRPEHAALSLLYYVPSFQQSSKAATEGLYLIAKEAFDHNYGRLEWQVNAHHEVYRAVADAAGFVKEGVLRHNVIVGGAPEDTVVYSMISDDWNKAAAAFDKWLMPSNFDSNGAPIKTLLELRA